MLCLDMDQERKMGIGSADAGASSTGVWSENTFGGWLATIDTYSPRSGRTVRGAIFSFLFRISRHGCVSRVTRPHMVELILTSI